MAAEVGLPLTASHKGEGSALPDARRTVALMRRVRNGKFQSAAAITGSSRPQAGKRPSRPQAPPPGPPRQAAPAPLHPRFTTCDGCAAPTPRCGKCRQPLPWIADADDATFGEVAEAAKIPVIVDLWAPWCGPCRMVSPALEQLARDLAGQVKLVKVNVDTSPQVSHRFGAQVSRRARPVPRARFRGRGGSQPGSLRARGRHGRPCRRRGRGRGRAAAAGAAVHPGPRRHHAPIAAPAAPAAPATPRAEAGSTHHAGRQPLAASAAAMTAATGPSVPNTTTPVPRITLRPAWRRSAVSRAVAAVPGRGRRAITARAAPARSGPGRRRCPAGRR